MNFQGQHWPLFEKAVENLHVFGPWVANLYAFCLHRHLWEMTDVALGSHGWPPREGNVKPANHPKASQSPVKFGASTYSGRRFVRVDRCMFMFAVWYGHKPGVVNCHKIRQVSQAKLASAMFSRKLSPERPFRLLICLPGKARSTGSMTVKLRYSIGSVGFRKGNFPCRCLRHGKGKISFRNAFGGLTVLN